MRLYHRGTCRLCDSRKMEMVVRIPPIPLAEKYITDGQLDQPTELFPVDLYMCLDCGHVQLLDVIDPEILWNDYTYRSGQNPFMVEHFRGVEDSISQRYKPAAGSLAVDVGSNDGSLLRPFKERGLRVLGVDPAKEIAREATESGIETIPELLTPELARRIRERHGPAGVITAFNVFAHTDDMSGFADSIVHMMASDSVFVFEAQYLLDIIDYTLLGTIFHEHLCHHSVKPMCRFLERHGMELIDVERVAVQHGSIIGTAQLVGGPRAVQPSVGELLALEQERRLDQPESIKVFADLLSQLRGQAGVLIEEWKTQGNTVAGYGAARSGPTLINQMGLGDAISYIFDDHPDKVHKYTPGHHIKVLPTADLYELMPDYVIILAWVYADKIIADNKEYLERGGRFVVCCPEVRVIGSELEQ